jgi:electron-transferring-flavoprotein dehydrogenase
MNAPIQTKAKRDQFIILTESNSYSIPHFLLPPQLHNDDNYIISLSTLVRWLGERAEELGVEIYPGFAADEILYDAEGSVRGVSG